MRRPRVKFLRVEPPPDSPLPSAFRMADVHHATVFFTGHVQGVGFRYTALQAAKEVEVAGFVTNLPDGRVQLEAEGRLCYQLAPMPAAAPPSPSAAAPAIELRGLVKDFSIGLRGVKLRAVDR